MNSLSVPVQNEHAFMRMDPDFGDIDCLVPMEPDACEVIEEGVGIWRVATSNDLVCGDLESLREESQAIDALGTEFDVEFEKSFYAFVRQGRQAMN